ncbi:hypothetical protein [Streptomyces sp. CMB-StM0423]|uniref:hypothetical protein n=1 Tax=Streptomyces sp. CMB-StM0423 TaxID=2059884 RepID=UPI000C70A8AC|nr:hypothetical protein [Streptomyces sp. CMB-StM0423]AUH41184.1 hypothetical protein CXR04_13830 [Streptomyces sp. CMB-StM0423]
MNRMRMGRRSARAMAVGAVAALGLAATATGTAAAAQPTQQQVPTYTCGGGLTAGYLVTGFDCTASAGAPRIGLVDGPFVITIPAGSFTCKSGVAAVPVTVIGLGCE